MMPALRAVLLRDLRAGVRGGGGFGLALVFFASVVAVAPFALGPDTALLARIGPALLWLAALLATLIGLDRLFASDAEDGTLDLLLASPAPLTMLVLAKVLAHWLLTGLPLALLAPLLGLMLNVPPDVLAGVAATLLAGTPALTLLGAIGAALTVGLKRGGLLAPILVLPLTVPVLIFGVSAVTATGLALPPLLVLAGLTLGALALAPLAAAAALKAAQG